MKTLQETKLSIAKENGFDTWSDLMSYVFSKTILDPEDWFDKVAKRYAQAACEDLRERIAEEAKTTCNCKVWNCEGDFKPGDKVDFLWNHSDEETNLAEFGTVYNVFDDYIVVHPYRSRQLLQCQPKELKLRNAK